MRETLGIEGRGGVEIRKNHEQLRIKTGERAGGLEQLFMASIIRVEVEAA